MIIGAERSTGRPRSAIVVGMGVAGLATAWFLQEREVDVTVVGRRATAASSSSGNGGWVAPGLTFPTKPSAGVSGQSWDRAMRATVALNTRCVEAFDVLLVNGVEAPVVDAPITAVFRTVAEAEAMLLQLRALETLGQTTHVTALSGEALREQVPLASPAVSAGLNINGQRLIDPRRLVAALGRAVTNRGGTTRLLEVDEVVSSGSDVSVHSPSTTLRADVAVIATGARLSSLAGRWLDIPVRAGRGFSFTVPVDRPMPSPIHLPDLQVGCTPYSDTMRVSGSMEFGGPSGRGVPGQVETIRPLLDGVRWAERSEVWVGRYPVVPDGCPLIGAVSPRVYVAGGHGLWGMTHGAETGRLLAEQITTGKRLEALAESDPLRRGGLR